MTIEQSQSFVGDDAPTQAFQLPRQRHAAPPQQAPMVPPQHQPAWQGQPQQPATHHHAPELEQKRSNGLATAGFVVALIGAVFSVIPFIGTIAWGIAPVGLVLSVVGLFMYRSRRSGRGLAIAGVLLAVFALIMCIVYTVSFANAVSNAPAFPATSAASSAPNTSSGSSSSPTSGAYGTSLTSGDLTLTASAPKKVSQSSLGTQYCTTVSYKNNGSDTVAYNEFDWKFRSTNGALTSAGVDFGDSSSALNSGQLNPGGTVSGDLCSDTSTKNVNGLVYSAGLTGTNQLAWQ